MITQEQTTSEVDWNRVVDLFAEVGWGRRDPEEVAMAFSRSTHVVFIYEDSDLIGLGRTVGDGRYYASIVDVVVKPEYQHHGIGSRIVRCLQEQLSGYVIVSITAAKEVRSFYERLGWKRQSTAMILPRDARQEALNCFGSGERDLDREDRGEAT